MREARRAGIQPATAPMDARIRAAPSNVTDPAAGCRRAAPTTNCDAYHAAASAEPRRPRTTSSATRRRTSRTTPRGAPERHPDPELRPPPADRVGRHAVQADPGQQQRQRAEEPRQHRHEPLLNQRRVHLFLHRTEGKRQVAVHAHRAPTRAAGSAAPESRPPRAPPGSSTMAVRDTAPPADTSSAAPGRATIDRPRPERSRRSRRWSLGSCGRPGCRTVRPMGFAPPKYLRANVSLTITTSGDPRRSVAAKSRPAIRRVPSVFEEARRDEVHVDRRVLARSAAARPGISNRKFHVLPADRRDRRHRDRTQRQGRWSRQSAHPFEQCGTVLRLEPEPLRIRADDEHGILLEAEIEPAERRERPHEEAGGDDQHERQRRPATTTSRLPRLKRRSVEFAAPLFLQRFVRRNPGGAERRRHPEQQRGTDRNGAGECENAPVERQVEEDAVVEAWRAGGRAGGCPSCAKTSPSSAPHPESSRLSASSCRISRSAGCAKRKTDADLVSPGVRAREQEVRDVRAGDQQHEADNHHDRRQRTL